MPEPPRNSDTNVSQRMRRSRPIESLSIYARSHATRRLAWPASVVGPRYPRTLRQARDDPGEHDGAGSRLVQAPRTAFRLGEHPRHARLWPDERHLALQDIDELGQLIQARPTQEPADRRNTRSPALDRLEFARTVIPRASGRIVRNFQIRNSTLSFPGARLPEQCGTGGTRSLIASAMPMRSGASRTESTNAPEISIARLATSVRRLRAYQSAWRTRHSSGRGRKGARGKGRCLERQDSIEAVRCIGSGGWPGLRSVQAYPPQRGPG